MPSKFLAYEKDDQEKMGSKSAAHFGSIRVSFEIKPTIIEEEQVKFMPISQYLEEAYNILAKAFKSGVIDWGLLERLKYHQKCVVDEGTNRPKSIKNKFLKKRQKVVILCCTPATSVILLKREVRLQGDRDSSNSDLCIMVIRLPSGIHDPSIDGKPPPMIQRWKPGGKCDRGTVQTSTLGNSGRLKLFLQGGSRANAHHAFHMISSFISCIQAFAICLAALHCWGPAIRSAALRKLSLPDKRSPPTSYQLHCPPLSPVGRA
ncbi:hypothetical protein ZIOFF_009491 [Zingiber officinale]|uniref:Uncharacterized protein n=1 Tax=Zingiber officinale TaxID=94328 RepID=A0A8J5HXX6_ZINOF|nr:hypothetical protein ZIOFF_009491 [Zingiber officinale]